MLSWIRKKSSSSHVKSAVTVQVRALWWKRWCFRRPSTFPPHRCCLCTLWATSLHLNHNLPWVTRDPSVFSSFGSSALRFHLGRTQDCVNRSTRLSSHLFVAVFRCRRSEHWERRCSSVDWDKTVLLASALSYLATLFLVRTWVFYQQSLVCCWYCDWFFQRSFISCLSHLFSCFLLIQVRWSF